MVDAVWKELAFLCSLYGTASTNLLEFVYWVQDGKVYYPSRIVEKARKFGMYIISIDERSGHVKFGSLLPENVSEEEL